MTKMTTLPGYKDAKAASKTWNSRLESYRKLHGYSIDDMVAMSAGNDPFWMTPGKILKAAWAKNVMDSVIKQHLRRINVQDIHLRDIHYILTGMNYRTWDGSEVYLNTMAHWKDLIAAFANARYLGMVDPNLIRDNKNKHDKRIDYRSDFDFTAQRVERGKKDLTKEKVLELFTSWFGGLKNWHNHMPVHIEIWAEKDLSLLEQVASKYKIDTVVGEGETSITQVYRIIDRIKEAGKPTRIAYISDCDVVGSNMSKAMSRKMEFIISQLDDDYDVKLTHLMLTPSHVNQYGLPVIPMKTSKSGAYETRKDDWMEARGLDGAVEINSFHALRPDEFRKILEDFILSYFDEEIKDKVIEFNDEQEEKVGELITSSDSDDDSNVLKEFMEKWRSSIDDIDWDEKEEDYDTEFQDMLDDHGEMDYDERDEHYQWLIDTGLGYTEQLNRYNEYEAGKLDNPEEDE